MTSSTRGRPHLSRIRTRATYSIDEVAKTLAVSKGTVRHWMRKGLRKIDDVRPYLIHGGDLFDFHKTQRKQREQKCDANQMFCFRCREPRHPLGLMVDVVFRNPVAAQIRGLCCECSTRMNRSSSIAKLAGRLKVFDQVSLLNPSLIERLPPSLHCYLKGSEKP